MFIDKRILIVEDDENSAAMIKALLENEGYQVEIATNGVEGLNKYKEKKYPIVITDIEMPQMSGAALIKSLKEYRNPPVIIVTTVHDDSERIIEIMKNGVYDYLIKPIDMKSLIIKIKRAFETAEQLKLKEITDRERIIRLENQLEWYKFEDRFLHGDVKKLEKSIFNNLQTSFNQGPGIGSLVTVCRLIQATAEKKGDSYNISSELYELLDKNIMMSEQALHVFQKMDNIISREIETETIDYIEFYNFIKEIIKDNKELVNIKSQQLLLSDLKKINADIKVNINEKELKECFNELILNASKFSIRNSTIIVMFQVSEKNIGINILNQPETDEQGRKGIPMGYENIVFEPFIRLTKLTTSEYNSLDYGLGLSYVEIVVKKHGGKISASNIIDYTNITEGAQVKVNFNLEFPVLDQNEE